MNRKGIRPRFKFGISLPGGGFGYRKSLPFRRNWLAIGFLVVLDAVFMLPLLGAFEKATSKWGSFDSLFDLVITMFLGAWMLGWSMAPLLITFLLLMMLFGREVIRARPGEAELFAGLPGMGISSIYDVSKMRNLRLVEPEKKSGTAWRGAHLVFDYGANPVSFGSNMDLVAQSDVASGIESASGSLIATGAARPEDLREQWETDTKPEPATASLADETRDIEEDPVTWTSPSSLALIIANLVPVAGALFLHWNLGDVMVLYWAESAVIGFFNLLKIIVVGRWSALFFGPFFIGHFGGFMSIHFLFIYGLFVAGVGKDMESGGDLAQVGKLFIALWPALAALFLSHAYSFFRNFVGREEYRGKTVQAQMGEPYSRIIFMHLVLIFGGGLAMLLHDPAPVLVLVIAIKVVMDLRAHIRERAPKK